MFQQNHEQAISQTELCFNDYVRNIENFDTEVRKLTEERDVLSNEVSRLQQDRVDKFKFCGAALVLLRHMLKQQSNKKLKESFTKWKF